MNVRSISMKPFMGHQESTVTLPNPGLVVVTGPNGSGKSSLVEAVSVAIYGRSLRGSDPWPEEGGKVAVETDAFTATRVRRGLRGDLSWAPPGEVPVQYETPTKAQEALEAVAEDFDVWRRTSVLSSQDATHFSLADDASRKRLVESFLGLTRFDDAHRASREDRKKAEALALRCQLGVRDAEAAVQMAVQRLQDAQGEEQEAFAEGAGVSVVAKSLAKARAALEKLEVKHTKASAELGDLGARLRALEVEDRSLQRQLDNLCTDCPTCKRPLNQQGVADARKELQAKLKASDTAIAALIDQVAQVKEASDEDARAYVAARERVRVLEREHAQAEAALRRAEQQAERVAKLEGAKARVLADRAGAQARHALASAEQATLEAVEEVLGLAGVRAHVLGQALGGIEAVANGILREISKGEMGLTLKPYSEKKSGGVKDALSLGIEGAARGLGYKATSGGQRRRVDVALLLGLAEVAQAAHGVDGGTLFFDEVFDALDEDGVEAVAQLLTRLSKERTVVVISHAPALVQRLPATQRLRVEGGAIKTLLS